jgi:hypothetical protein
MPDVVFPFLISMQDKMKDQEFLLEEHILSLLNDFIDVRFEGKVKLFMEIEVGNSYWLMLRRRRKIGLLGNSGEN